MKWHYREHQDLLFIDKPEGAFSLGSWSEHLGQELQLVHTPEGTTSGAMVLTKTEEAATRLKKIFTPQHPHPVQQSYWFLTDRASANETFAVGDGVARTTFMRIKRSPYFELWSANTVAATDAQIRTQARDLGLPILGDQENGGARFTRLCLHLVSLQIPGLPEWVCPAPRIFERMGLLRNPEICAILSAIDRRHRQFAFLSQPDETLRLVHFEVPGIEVDLLGRHLWVSWFREEDPSARDLEMWECVGRMLNRPVLIQKRWNREKKHGPAPKWMSTDFPEIWFARENGVQYEFRRGSSESHGLFLDQRQNRERMAKAASGKSLLNLFAYTGGFSLAAALSGATATTTVDLSANATEWAKQNFALNHRLSEEHEFYTADSFFFLERAQKRQRTWDFIVCDPPIFSRNKEQVFRIEKDAVKLLKLCRSVLAPNGQIFFSTHYEQWSVQDLELLLKTNFPGARITPGKVDPDFPKADLALKSFFLRF